LVETFEVGLEMKIAFWITINDDYDGLNVFSLGFLMMVVSWGSLVVNWSCNNFVDWGSMDSWGLIMRGKSR
jgi:hypothetical protein